MTLLQVLVLALVQGITEFLPISSSAHLILVPHVFGWQDQGLHFDVAVNTGTLLALLWYFRRDLSELTVAGLAGLKTPPSRWDASSRLAWQVALGTIPVGIAGLLVYDWVATAARDPRLIATTTILFGLLLGWVDRSGTKERGLETSRWKDALLIGVAQALALVPGTSRSGITMTAALAAGFDRTAAARFSFLLAVPVGVLAAAKDAWEILENPIPAAELGDLFLGLVLSAIAAYFTIGWLLAWVRRQTMDVFVVYRLVLGVVILAVWFAG